jgi:uncharacterized repeat protein (TIGR01451 family)
MRKVICLTLVLCLHALPASALNYYVSTTGNDGADGLAAGTAWRSLDNGDAKGLLAPGDTVFVEPGTYMPDRSYIFTTSGTAVDPIVYIKTGGGAAAVRTLSGTNASLWLRGDHIEIHALDICSDILAGVGGIQIDGDSCLVTECIVHGVSLSGIRTNGRLNRILKNIIYSGKNNGLDAGASSAGNSIYGNTIYNNTLNGLRMAGTGNHNRIFNNLVVGNGQYGVNGPADNVCGFNDVWGNGSGNLTGGVVDSAGGISADPLFVNGPGHDFNLQSVSPAINAGLDLGYPYCGPAPDMGALESDVAPPAGTAIWRSDASGIPRYSEWDGISFGVAENTADVGAWRIIAGAEAPARDEKVLVGINASAEITLQTWNGTAWTASPLNPLGAVSETFWWGCDVAYMSRSGDALVVWNNGSSGTDGLSYRVGNRVGWSDEDTIAVPLAGEPKHMHLATSPTSDEMILVVSNELSKDYAIVWDGSAWGDARILDNSGAGDDRTDIYAVYEQHSGEALVVYGCGLPTVYYSIWNGTSWSAAQGLAKPADATGTARWMTLAADPNSDRIALGVLTTDQDAWLCVWDGSAWDVPETATNSMTGTTYPGIAVAFEGLVGEALATYGEASQVRYRTWAEGTGWSGELQVVSFGETPNSMTLDAAPNSDQIMLSVQGASGSLNCVRWDGSSWGAPTELESNTGEVKNQPFVFLWGQWVAVCDLAVSKSVDAGNPSVGDLLTYTLTVSNNGPSDAHGIEIVDLLPVGVTYHSHISNQGAYDSSAGVWAVGDLAGGSSAWLELRSSVDPGTEGTTISNFAEVSCLQESDPDPGNDAESVDVVVNRPPELAGIGPQSAEEGANLNFTVTASDPDGTIPVLTAEGIPANAGFTDNGDGTGTFAFNPDYTQAGLYGVLFIASDGALADSEAVAITVEAAPLAYIIVNPDSAVVSADSTVAFSASGYDAGGEAVDAGTITWGLVDPLGTIDSSGVFDAVAVGVTRVTALSSLGPADTTARLEVIPGDISFLDVQPSSQVIVEGSSCQFHSQAYDADSNPVADVTAGAEWSTTDPSGTVTEDGVYTAGGDPSPPTYLVRATLHLPLGSLHALSDSGEVTVVSNGSLRYIRIELANGTEVRDTTLTADNDTTRLYCRGYDSADGLIGGFEAVWTVLGDDSVGSVDQGPVTQTQVRLHKNGTIRVAASYAAGISDTTGLIVCLAGRPARLVIDPDTQTLVAGEVVQFEASPFDADGNPTDPVSIDEWNVIGAIGEISESGLLTATTAGTGRVVCRGAGLADTSGTIDVLPGVLSSLEVEPDSIEIALGGTATFTASGYDAYGNITEAGGLTWAVVGGIGRIDDAGFFTALAIGTGRVAASGGAGGVVDTNRVVRVIGSDLDMLVISPDTASVKVSGRILFSAHGFDAALDPVEAGSLTWEVLGGIGTIDDLGWFTATTPGAGKIAATSAGGTTDTTRMIVVQVPRVEEMPIGHRYVHAGETGIPILAFRISNAFDHRETLEGVTVRDASRGEGTAQQIRSNIDSLALYLDSDGSSSLSPTDVLLSSAAVTAGAMALSFPPVTIAPGAERAFLVTIDISAFPRDGDSLDMYLVPASDIDMAGGTVVAGPDIINSLGYDIVEGLIARQIALFGSGLDTVSAQDGLFPLVTIDVPKNGYSDDVLKILSVFNAGSADTADIESLLVYRDDGNGVWDTPGEEIRIGQLHWTGDQWQVSGLSEGLTAQTTRFYLAAKISPRASNGRTLAFGIPLHGLEMKSDNDGPVDAPVGPVDTMTIKRPETVSITRIAIPACEVVPGASTGPVLGLKLSNGYGVPVRIDTLDLASALHDPGGTTQEMLDSQIQSVRLWMNLDGDYTHHTSSDRLISSGRVVDGAVSFATPGLVIPPGGGVIGLFVECILDAEQSKNGNTIGFIVGTGSDIHFDAPVSVTGDFPLTNGEDFVINAFPANAVTVFTVRGTTLFGGQSDMPLLDFVLPRNGYADDELETLRVRNTGTTAGRGVFSALRLWVDVDDDGFSSEDIPLGYLDYRQDGTWEIDGLAVPVAVGGRRFVITGDVASRGFDGGTARFELSLKGVSYASGMDGPDDEPVANGESHFILPPNRITVIPIPSEPSIVWPGASAVPVLTFALYNGYPDETHVLRGVNLADDSRTRSSEGFADYELGQVSLHLDMNGNQTLDDDSLLAAGYFEGGELFLGGLDVGLAPESLAYFFATLSVPLDVIDSDTLAVTIHEPSDFAFDGTVNINGEFPVSRGGSLVIDGSVRAQYELLGLESRTLSPGDESVPVLAFRPAINGDRTDILDSLTIVNLGSAGAGDVCAMRLYLDANGDGVWQPSDLALADGIDESGSWRFGGLDLEVADGGGSLMVVADISESAASGGTLQAAIPVGGCQYASSNDGPLDGPLVSGQTFAISSSGLKVTYEKLMPKYSIGQSIILRVAVTNLLPVSASGIRCDILPAGGGYLVDVDSTDAGPVSLGPDETAQFYARYTAAHAGEAYWRVAAFSSDPQESSGVIFTEPVAIQSTPANVRVEMISSVPAAVTRGQTRVFPMSIRYRQSDNSPLAASIRLDSLRIHVEDETDTPELADRVFSRLVLATGYTNLAIVDEPPHDSVVSLSFTVPATLSPGQEQVLSLRVDIDSSATAESFALAFESGEDLRFVDCNTQAPVPIDPTVSFPLRTASCRVSNPSQELAVSYSPALTNTVNCGQTDVDVMKLILRHPGRQNSSQVQLTGVSLRFVDADRNGIAAGDVFESIRLVRRQSVIGEVNYTDMDDDVLTVRLAAAPVLSSGQTDTVKVEVDARPDPEVACFGMEVQDSTWFVLRDVSSGAIVKAVSDGEAPTLGGIFPMWSGSSCLMQPAGAPQVCAVSHLPASVVAGSDAVELLELTVHHLGGADQSSIRLEDVRVAVTDSLGLPLDPRLIFDRVGVKIDGGAVEYQPFTKVEAGYAVFDAGAEGLVIEPGSIPSVVLVADLEADTPFDHFVLKMQRENGLAVFDNTDKRRMPGVEADPVCPNGLPFTTDVTGLFLPAGSPVVKRHIMGTRVAYPGQRGLVFFQSDLAYKSSGPQADVVLEDMKGRALRRTSSGLIACPASEAFAGVYLLVDNNLAASDTALIGDTIVLTLGSGHVIPRGEAREITLACDLRTDAGQGNYLISFDDSTFMTLLDGDLGTRVSPLLVGDGYPLLTEDVSITQSSLSGSFVNFPNPFDPDRGPGTTTLSFYLPEEADVTIEVFGITGELVATLAGGARCQAGINDEVNWDGKNEDGRVVLPGTYFCRVKARYGSGSTEEAVRRVAVIR